jgi:hypothetical protein
MPQGMLMAGDESTLKENLKKEEAESIIIERKVSSK